MIYVYKNSLKTIDIIPNFLAIQKQEKTRYNKKLIEARKTKVMPQKPKYIILDIGIINIIMQYKKWLYSPNEQMDEMEDYCLSLIKMAKEATKNE